MPQRLENTPALIRLLCSELCDADRLRRWPNVLIHAEEILRIVLCLCASELIIVLAVRSSNTLFPFSFHHEVDVRSPAAVWMQLLPIIPCPGGDVVRVGWIGVHSHNHLAPRGVAVIPGSIRILR